jgi:hypothetical protein
MKLLYVLTFFLVAISVFSFAQTENNIIKTYDYINTYATEEVKFNPSVKIVRYNEILCSPFLIDSFTIGSIYTYKGEHFQNIPIRYNIFTDNIEYIMGASSVLELKNPETVEKIEFKNYKLIYLSNSGRESSISGFFIVLAEGVAMLLAKPYITLQKPNQQGYNDSQPPSFIRHPDTYFLKTGDNVRLLATRKKLIRSFPKYRKEVTNYIKTNHIKINDKQGLTELVNYYNSLP